MLEYPQRFARNIPNSNSASSGNSTVSQQQYPPQLPLHQNQNYRQLATTSSGSGSGSPVHHQRQSSLLQQQHHRTLSTASSCSAQHKSVTFGQPALSAPTADYSNNGSSSGNSSSCSAAGNAAGPQSMAGNMKHGKITQIPKHSSSSTTKLTLFSPRKISRRRLLRGSQVRLCRAGSTGVGSTQERALSTAGRLQALVACPEQSQSVRLCAQQLCEEGEAFPLRQVRVSPA